MFFLFDIPIKRSTTVRALLLLAATTLVAPLAAQTSIDPTPIVGTVVEINAQHQQSPIAGANVYWVEHTQTAVSTDQDGNFSIAPLGDHSENANSPTHHATDKRLVITFVGYENDTIDIGTATEVTIALQNGVSLDAVEVRAVRGSTFISTLDPRHVEIITTQELRRAACCNLSESFETNATVDVSYADAVSGAKEIRMLGLDGVYAQLMTEGIPSLRGLANTYGLSYIPGSWVSSMQVTKGSGSVVNGYEPITGQINVELQKPETADRLHLNLFGGMGGRYEVNANWAVRLTPRWSTMTMAHASTQMMEQDYNKDSFLDAPLRNTLSGIHRWKYQGDKLESIFGVKALYETRTGGQIGFDPDKPTNSGTPPLYGIQVNANRYEAFAKTGFFFPEPYRSIGTQVTGIYHQQDMQFGDKNYTGNQTMLWANFIYQSRIVNCDHEFKVGGSWLYDRYDEQYSSGDTTLTQLRTDIVSGVFGEYTYKGKKTTLVAGLRTDYHPTWGLWVNPRLHLRYQVAPNSVLRAAAGRGTRIANIFAENANIFANGRTVTIGNNLRPETAWNYGISWVQKWQLAEREGYLTADAFRTDFTNQVITDLYSDTQSIGFYNLDGASYANSVQVEAGYEVLKGWQMRIAYKADDAQTTYNDGKKRPVPFQARQKALLNVAYKTPDEHWRFDFTTQWHGKRPLPFTANSTAPDDNGQDYSPTYWVLLGQVTYAVGQWEFYVGGENLNNFMQPNPIVNPESPFSSQFDATNIWGPIMGAQAYGGIRFSLK